MSLSRVGGRQLDKYGLVKVLSRLNPTESPYPINPVFKPRPAPMELDNCIECHAPVSRGRLRCLVHAQAKAKEARMNQHRVATARYCRWGGEWTT